MCELVLPSQQHLDLGQPAELAAALEVGDPPLVAVEAVRQEAMALDLAPLMVVKSVMENSVAYSIFLVAPACCSRHKPWTAPVQPTEYTRRIVRMRALS